jgi:hypothetical protein
MARSIAARGDILSRLQTLGRDIGGQRGGGHRDDGAGQLRPPLPAMPAWRAPITSDEAERLREAAEQLHASRNPGAAVCSCGCMRWESSRDAAGALIWLCSGCHLRHGAKPLPRAEPIAPLPPLDPEVARETLKAAVEARQKAVDVHAALSRAADSARSAVTAAEQLAESSAAALTEARVQAREAATRALQAGRAAPAIDLGQPRGLVEKASDGLLAAQEARAELEAQRGEARKALASSQAKADAAAIATVGAEIGVPLIARMVAQTAQLTRDMAALNWLTVHRAHWSPDMQALLALGDQAPRNWPQADKTATEVASSLDRAVAALACDPATEIPQP